MAGNETTAPTNAEVFADTTGTNRAFKSTTTPDTIKGWNDRRKSNNQVISSLVPFVQLIALFDEEEYNRMFKMGKLQNVDVVFSDGTTAKSEEYDKKYTPDPNFIESIKKQVSDRAINLYIVSSIEHGLRSNPIEGIVMAETVTQEQDPSGGIGITDLQVDYGKSNILGSRKFVLRMTINDPKILDDRFEYGKLATFGAQMLIIYGWSNPEVIPGYDAAMAPPKLVDDEQQPSRKKMVVPIRDLGNGGYWSAGRVNVSKYDFGFNEMGKLEMTIELRDDATLGLSSTVMSSVAARIKNFLGGGLDKLITASDGTEFKLKDALLERQKELNEELEKGTVTYDQYTSMWALAEESLQSELNFIVTDRDELSYSTEEDVRARTQESTEEQKGYPYQTALFSYKQILENVIDHDPIRSGSTDDDPESVEVTSVPTKQVVSYERTPAYYYLGAIMDSVSLSMASTKLGIGSAKVPSFFYRDLNEGSNLSTAFQAKLKSVNRATGMEERIQEAIIRLKERFLPPASDSWRDIGDNADLSDDKFTSVVSGVLPVYNGIQEENKTKVLSALFPPPPNIGKMAGAPMRGFNLKIDTGSAEDRSRGYFASGSRKSNVDILEEVGLQPVGELHCFIPDWKQEITFDADGNEVISVGSPEGFDPLNPSEYKAKDRGGKFWMIVSEGDGSDKEISILSYDRWRLSHGEMWDLLTKKWDNLYREYLGDYFESVIRKKINQLQFVGMPIEAIYNQPLDLDWLTGIIYSNSADLDEISLKSWADTRESSIEVRDEGKEIIGKFYNDLDIDQFKIKLNEKTTRYNDIIAQNNEIIKGIDYGHRAVPQDVQFKPPYRIEITLTEAEERALYDADSSPETAEIKSKYPDGGFNVWRSERYMRYTELIESGQDVDAGSLQAETRRLVEIINNIKLEVEQLTGGRYERNSEGNIITKDIMPTANIIMVRFKNFDRVMASKDKRDPDMVQYEMDSETGVAFGDSLQESWAEHQNVSVFEPKIKYKYKSSTPEIQDKWILWNDYKVPTNNFQNQFNEITREWVDRPNKAERWKQANANEYQNGVLSKLETDNQILDLKIRSIKQYQKELDMLYDHLYICEKAIDNARNGIIELNRKNEALVEFFIGENPPKLELSIYDDTSDFDGDGLFVPVGREEPMHLTTKVAQQWYLRMRGGVIRGAMDVKNYGPPQGGYKYSLPSNHYKFTFSKKRRSWQVMGQPMRILDPAIFEGIEGPVDAIKLADQLLGNLSYGIKPVETDHYGSRVLSKDMDYEDIERGRITEKSYKNWSLFGRPGIPNENENNEWGFKYGPPIKRGLANNEIELTGGNYVENYGEFLDLFGLGYNEEWPNSLRITGKWPSVDDTSTALAASSLPDQGPSGSDWKRLADDSEMGLPVYTIIDGAYNILVDDGNGWYIPSGWYLDYDGDPVYLYPSRKTACKINNSTQYKQGQPPGGVLQTGGLDDVDSDYDRQAIGAGWKAGHHSRWAGGDETGGGSVNEEFQGRQRDESPWSSLKRAAGDWWDITKERFGMLFDGEWEALDITSLEPTRRVMENIDHRQGQIKRAIKAQQMKKLNDGDPVNYNGDKPSFGARIGEGEHCMNLDLDMKESMVIWRPSVEDPTSFLGKDNPTKAQHWSKINFDVLIKDGEFYRFREDYQSYKTGDLAPYSDTIPSPARFVPAVVVHGETIEEEINIPEGAGPDIPAPGATVIGPLVGGYMASGAPYGNQAYPYGTGYYEAQSKRHGPYAYAQHGKNWASWGRLLKGLGEENGYGFFTQVDNSNYTSCMVQPNGIITDGIEINDGFVKFIIENVYAPLPKNRRCGARYNHKPIAILSSGESDYEEKHRLEDVTYRDLFGPLRQDDDEEAADPVLAPASFGNINNFEINNVKNIPIRRELIDNLVNKNNTNMSMTQFFGEILRPGAIGINSAGNQNVAIRQNEDGVFEVFALSSIDWDSMTAKYAYLFNDPIGSEDLIKKRFPQDIIMLDFKASDSLIENMDMNSTFDPLVARAFRNAADDFTADTDAFINFLSYKGIAPELIHYLEINYPAIQNEEKKALMIDKGSGDVTINKELFMKENKTTDVVANHITKFLQQDPGRLNAMRALLHAANSGQTNPEDAATKGKNYSTQLLANYMRKTTITIHGTTNIQPFQSVIVKGVMPDLEGMYLITNTRESITPQGFQTILEGTLLRPPSANARGSAKNPDIYVPERQEDEVAKLSADSEGISAQEAINNVETGVAGVNSGTGGQQDMNLQF